LHTKMSVILLTARKSAKPIGDFSCCNRIRHSVSAGGLMRESFQDVSLFNRTGSRKYLNATEQLRFIEAAQHAPLKARHFCLTLGYSGARISEVLAITPGAIDIESCAIGIRTLKRRNPRVVRQVPVPLHLLDELDRTFEINAAQRDRELAIRRIWRFSRTTAWRYVKAVMAAAQISGTQAMPKGLRHAFGVSAYRSVPPHLVQRWLGHARLETTSIYGDVVGPEEREFAARMWKQSETLPQCADGASSIASGQASARI
jgi:integrase/recombinase XerD